MGLLEDAIREHLELKRRRGASNEEVSRQESEALGPPGRPTPLEETAAASLREEPPAPAPSAAVHEREELLDVQVEEHDPDEVPAEDRLEEEPATRLYDDAAVDDEWEDLPPRDEPAAVAASDAETRIAPAPRAEPPEEDLHDEELVDGEPAPEPAAGPGPGQPRLPGTGEEDPEDVLEETPEFLQETPEHDRLWFEQKPPRDFDY